MLRSAFFSKTIYVIFALLLVAGCGSGSKPKFRPVVGIDAPVSTTSTTSDNGTTSDTGTTGGASAKDIVPPGTSIASGPGGIVNAKAASFTFTGTDNVKVAGFACRLNAASWASCVSPKTYSNLTDGEYTFDVRAIDAAGNVDATPTTRSWTVDTVPPDTSLGSSPSALTNTDSVSFTFSSVDGITFECDLDSGGPALCSSPKSYTGLRDGVHTFGVRAIDVAGNTDPTPATASWIVDTLPPDTSFVSGASGLVSSSSNSFVFTCDQGVCTYQCAVNAGAFAGCITPYAFAGQTDATYTLQVRATDAAGNTDASPVGVSWTVDSTPPVANISDGPASTTSTTSATDGHFVFACNEVGCTTWCAMDGVAATTCNSSMDVTGLTTNLHTFAVTAVDLAGNATTSVTSQTWRVITVPESYWQPISGGTFVMGDAFHEGDSQELPVHAVTLSPFDMMSYEVTNGTYADCVVAGSCTAPGTLTSYSGRSPYYGNATYADYPVIYVNWQQAVDYCSWAGGRLPTEAQWEYAARGGLSGKRFPWGDTIDCSNANYYTTDNATYDVDPYVGSKYCAIPGDTTQVGSYAANGYGLYDMAGNVLDWVNDWDGGSYPSSHVTDPQGPATGSTRVVRGGVFTYGAYAVRVAYRTNYTPALQYYSIGVRCVR